MTDLVPVGFPSSVELQTAWNIANKIASTEFVPGALQGRPEAVLAAVLAGRELRVGPMQALAKIHIIEGRPAPAPELMAALVLRDGHEIRVVETTNERCVVWGRRRGDVHVSEPTEVVWTLEDAVRAGLCTIRDGQPYARSKHDKPLSWEKYPRAMLRSRAVAELCRAAFPDVLAGFSYTPEEMGAEVDEEGQPIEAAEKPRIPPYTVNPDTGELETVEAVNEIPYVHQEREEDVADPSEHGEGRTGQPNHPEPPEYADEKPGPNAQELAIRAKQAGGPQAWLDLLKQAKTDAQEQGVDYPDRTSQIDQHGHFRDLLRRKVEELEQQRDATQETSQ